VSLVRKGNGDDAPSNALRTKIKRWGGIEKCKLIFGVIIFGYKAIKIVDSAVVFYIPA
jgi:hypothetical protein